MRFLITLAVAMTCGFQVSTVSASTLSPSASACKSTLQARAKRQKIQLTWQHTGANQYRIYRASSPSGPFTAIATTSSSYSTYLDDRLPLEQIFYYQVADINTQQVESSRSTIAFAKTTRSRPNRRNKSPVIQTTAPAQAAVNTAYVYDVNATDPNAGDQVSYMLSQFPDGMTINLTTGVINWLPGKNQVGKHCVIVRAYDAAAKYTEQNFVVEVKDPSVNHPPIITSTPPLSTNENEPFIYDVDATDPDQGDVINYKNRGFLDNVALNSKTGEFRWSGSDHLPVYSKATNPFCSVPQSTNEPFIDASKWTVLRDKGSHGGSQSWGFEDNGTVAITYGNGAPSILLSDIELSDGVMEISLRNEGGDNDHFGFVWGFQDKSHYYRFRWDHGNGVGMDVTKIATPEPRFEGEHPTDVKLFANPKLRWEYHVDYKIILDVRPGLTHIYVAQGNRLLQAFSIPDDTYLKGRFGFYVHSQSEVFYRARLLPREKSADLIVDSVELIPGKTEDTYRVSVLNRGSGPSKKETSVNLKSAFFHQVGGASFKLPIGTAKVPPLAAGEIAQLTFKGPVLNSDRTLLEAVIDEESQDLLECNENNNTIRLPLVWIDAEDKAGAKDTQRFAIQLNDINEVPKFTSKAAQYAVLDKSFSYNVIATDSDVGDQVRYELVEGPAGMSFYVGTGLLVWTPDNSNLHKSYPVKIRAIDLQGANIEQSFTVTVQRSPIITSTPNIVARSGENYQYLVTATDPDNDPLKFSLKNAPNGMTIDEQSGVISWVPNAHGKFHEIIVEVTDNKAGIDQQQYTLAVLAPGEINTPPVITSTPGRSAPLLTTYTYDVEATDVDNDKLRYRLLEAPAAMLINEDNGLITWVPAVTQRGDYTVSIEVTDLRGGVTKQTFTIAAGGGANNNNPPTITSSPATQAQVAQAYSYAVTATDANGDTLTYRLEVAPTGMTINPTSGLINWTPTQQQIGVNSVSVRVTDSKGGVTSQQFTVTVNAVVNKSPVITSSPGTAANAGQAYRYTVTATDADGDSLTYQLEAAPKGMTINANSGLISWTPANNQQGANEVVVRAEDGNGGIATQTFTIHVTAGAQNTPPTITSTPLANGAVDTAYQYAVIASDADGDAISYSLTTAPAGMQIDRASGAINWTPTAGQAGVHNVVVRAADAQAYIEQSFTINVAKQALPLTVSVVATPAVIDKGQTTTVSVITTGGVGAINLTLTVNGNAVALDNNGRAIVTGDTVGNYSLAATAKDTKQLVSTTGQFSVRDPNDATKPTVEIKTPATDSEILAPVEIVGTATDDNFVDYRLLISPAGKNQFTEITKSTTPVVDGVLGQFDPTQLVNGLYNIALIARDVSGNEQSQQVTYRVNGDMKVGNFSFTVEDLTIPVAGIPIRVTRTYDSRRRHEKLDFGYGWSVGYQDVKIEETRVPGKYWSLNSYKYGPFNVLTRYCVEPNGAPQVIVTLPDGDQEVFEVKATPQCNNLSAQLDVTLSLEPVGDTQSTLKIMGDNTARLVNGNLVETGTFTNPINPNRYQLTTRAGYVYELDQNFGITKVTVPTGHTLTYSDAGIVHSSGKSVLFNRDGDGKITSITDPKGNTLQYSYSAQQDLVKATDQLNATTTYTYNQQHGLLDIKDPLGRKLVKNIYDDKGKLIAQEDSDGNRTEFNHDLAGRFSLVTDRNGNITQLFYDEQGNVLTRIDALGNTTSYTYDARGNQLTQVDALGFTQIATYNDKNDQLTQVDALGNTTTYSYNTRGQETQITDARGNTFHNTYDSLGNLLTVTDPNGKVAGNTINAQGLVTRTVDVLGNATQYTYDKDGNKLTETDAEGHVTRYSYDANGNVLTETRTRNGAAETTRYVYDARNRVIKTTDPLGNVTTTVYDLAGREVGTVDALGQRTEMAYDAYGRLISTRYSDGSVATKTYDREGNLLSETDKAGRTTQYSYDALNRQTKVTYPDGSSTQTVYDAIGRVTAEIDANGNRTEYEYDAAGRRTLSRDAAGNEHRFEYDAEGNLIAEVDAKGHRRSYVYNKLDQRIETRYHNGSKQTSTLDALSRRTSQADQASVKTTYEYDKLGRLTKVTDALGGTTTFSYDSAGNKLTQTDAEGRTTRWAYDALGRVTSRTLPMGQTEGFSYDGNGNLTEQTDFNGQVTRHQYDSMNRLIQSEYADGRVEAFQYDAMGNRTQVQVTPVNGPLQTTTYNYDQQDRLTSETKPDGSVIHYQYDPVGNRTQVQVAQASGQVLTTDYNYDKLNRLQSVTDAKGTTTYGYDAVGNRTSVSYPNGTSQVYSYDSLNRLTKLETFSQGGGLIQSYSYTLHPTGRRTQIDESNGRTTAYSYDQLYRLTSETITDAVNGNYSASYQYDKVGNRTQSVADGVTTRYTYDSNDRLTQQGGSRYTYDNNGSTLTETLDNKVTTYTYDAKNKLASAEKEGKTTSYRYNHNGIRTGKTENGVTTQFIVDENRDYAQVLVESDGANQVNYTYGDDLISQDRNGASSYYHYDGLGSTRALTDAAGATTDTYNYEAFGVLLNSMGNTKNNYLFTGEQFDSGLDQYYLRARYYNQKAARFTQMDTWMGVNHDPVTLHKYLYANVDPVNYTDPTGNFGLPSFGVGFNVAGILTTLNIASSAYDLFGVVSNGESITAAQAGMFALASLGGIKLFKILGKKFLKKFNCEKPGKEHKICRIFKSDSERISFIRRTLGLRAGQRNVAFADYITTSGVDSIIGVSGRTLPGTEGIPVSLQTGWDGHNRSFDAEVKLYSTMTSRFTTSTTGLVRVVSELNFCGSCTRVGTAFKLRHPKLFVMKSSVLSSTTHKKR
ncbi:putative Ig domain-containing protein [Endozoicomonas sp. SM1973]|uniref:Ig domain-containing protein n=1 Tax=Spartinivicinus marinus TaxID=2994442 RepID=A0A853I053_9GAMM|nr:putative Ig domain-containing protein [Spartinivicinus marinus]MCX4030004.1 putative Ig domain-containing protein [Spartinivicinus marinus]NYZ64752.1 putative Ig domain-containing protein [Spartinivicinus marinus]